MSGLRAVLGLALCALFLGACDRGTPGDEAAPADTALPDTLTSAEQSDFAVELDRYQEMQGGRLDTVDMIARSDDAAFHVQVLNYGPGYTALTYAAWYTGPDSAVMFAADDQPRWRFLQKPFTPQSLTEAVREAFAAPPAPPQT